MTSPAQLEDIDPQPPVMTTFPQFKDFPVELQFMVWEEATAAAAADLPGLYPFDFTFREEAARTNNLIASFRPHQYLRRATYYMRSLGQICCDSRKSALNAGVGNLVVTWEERVHPHVRTATIPFDFEKSYFCIVDPKMAMVRQIRTRNSQSVYVVERNEPARLQRPDYLLSLCVGGFEFAPEVKNLAFAVHPSTALSHEGKSTIRNVISRFGGLPTTLINCKLIVKSDAWAGTTGCNDGHRGQVESNNSLSWNAHIPINLDSWKSTDTGLHAENERATAVRTAGSEGRAIAAVGRVTVRARFTPSTPS